MAATQQPIGIDDDELLNEFFTNNQTLSKVDPIIEDSYVCHEFLCKAEANDLLSKIENLIKFVPREKIYYRGNSLSRDIQFFSEFETDGAYPLYRFPGIYDNVKPLPFPDFLQEIVAKIFKFTGQKCNHLVLNRYLNGDDKIGPHNDKTKDWFPDTAVITLSLGFKRNLVISENNGREIKKIKLRHGSLYLLGSKTNLLYKHSIPPENIADIRYALTFRAIKTKKNPDGTIIE